MKIVMKLFLILASILISGSIFGISNSIAEEWNEYLLTGKYYYSEPPISDQIFIFPYQISNGSFSRMEFPQEGTLRIDIYHTIEEGTFEFKYPRNYPYSEGIFDDFFVIVSGEESRDYEKIDTECYYQFRIPFKAGSRQIILPNGGFATTFPFIGEEVPQHCIDVSIAKFSINEFSPKNIPHIYKGCPPGQLETNLPPGDILIPKIVRVSPHLANAPRGI